jgi:hypothetical protein
MAASNPVMFVVLFPLLYLLSQFMRRAMWACSRAHEMMLESKSPIFSQISLVRQSLFSIRSYDLVDYFRKRFEKLSILCSLRFFSHYSIIQWLHFRNDMTGLLFICINIAAVIVMAPYLDKSMIALSLSLTTTVIINLVWTMY